MTFGHNNEFRRNRHTHAAAAAGTVRHGRATHSLRRGENRDAHHRKARQHLVDNGFFTSSGIIENIAQTCAARIGYVNKYILRKGIQLGFIGAIRNLRLHRLPAAGQEIETAIVTVEEVFGMTLVTATVKSGDNDIIAECEMKIAVSEVDSQSV